jgi:energy-coupling factor transporter ATP-binding protein EcfA2
MKKTARTFNANGRTDKTKHFFVEPDLSVLLEKIESRCFISVVNPSQTGKTTLMAVLQEFLKDQYTIINFQFPIVSNKSHIFPMVRAEIQQQLRIQFNNDITITEDNMKDLFSIGNKQRYFQGKQALLIVDEVQGLALADDDQRTAFLASWCQCKDQQENQALQASICVTNYMGEYFIGSPFSNTDCVNPKYFNLEQVGQMFKDYDEEYNVITSDKIVESIYSQSGGSPGLTQILGSLYHNQRLLYEESIDNQMLEDEKENKKMEADDMCDVWEEFSTSKRILFAVQQNQNYKKMLSLLQSDHNLAKAVAYSVVAQSVITDPARVDQLFCYNILKADPKKGYCLANPFISRLFHVFYQAEPVTSYRFIKTEGEFDFLSLLYATIPVMNSIALSRGPRLPSKNGIPKPKEAVFVQEYKTALLHVIRDSTRM